MSIFYVGIIARAAGRPCKTLLGPFRYITAVLTLLILRHPRNFKPTTSQNCDRNHVKWMEYLVQRLWSCIYLQTTQFLRFPSYLLPESGWVSIVLVFSAAHISWSSCWYFQMEGWSLTAERELCDALVEADGKYHTPWDELKTSFCSLIRIIRNQICGTFPYRLASAPSPLSRKTIKKMTTIILPNHTYMEVSPPTSMGVNILPIYFHGQHFTSNLLPWTSFYFQFTSMEASMEVKVASMEVGAIVLEEDSFDEKILPMAVDPTSI